MEVLIKLFFTHINTIIYVLTLITAVLFGVIFIFLLGKDGDASDSGIDGKKISDLEILLKKMLESAQNPNVVKRTGIVDEEDNRSISSPAATNSPVAPVVIKEVDTAALNEAKNEVQSLKSAVTEKDGIIAKLKSSLELAQQDQLKKSEPSAQMQEKMKDLEAKLAEYEIIEDDIADLTMYKEENAQLKEQIKQLMKGQPIVEAVIAPAPTPPPAPVGESTPPPTTAAEVVSAPAVESAPDPAPTPEPVSDVPQAPPPVVQPPSEPKAQESGDTISDELLAEFKAALSEPQPSKAIPVTPLTVEKPLGGAVSQEVEERVDDDLMAEFEKALSEQRKSDAAPIQIMGPIPTFPISEDDAKATTQDIMAEFVTDVVTEDGLIGTNVQMPIDEDLAVTAVSDPLSATDPNKMISEVESLTAGGNVDDPKALEGDTDTDKMIKEMEDFKKIASGN